MKYNKNDRVVDVLLEDYDRVEEYQKAYQRIYRQVRSDKVKYLRAKHCAAGRGIPWQFTFDTWMEWWGEDLERRGKRPNDLVMARNGDTGPYHPDNVRKITYRENQLEDYQNRPGRKYDKEKNTKDY